MENTSQSKLYHFTGEYIQKFILIEEQFEMFIKLFFNESERKGKNKINWNYGNGNSYSSYANIRNDLRQQYLQQTIFNRTFGFKEKYESFLSILTLINPNFYKRIEGKFNKGQPKKNYFTLIKLLSELRNFIAHNNFISYSNIHVIAAPKGITLNTNEEYKYSHYITSNYKATILKKKHFKELLAQIDSSLNFAKFCVDNFDEINLALNPISNQVEKMSIDYFIKFPIDDKIFTNGVFRIYINMEQLIDTVINKKYTDKKKPK